jgi:hypothetical protein
MVNINAFPYQAIVQLKNQDMALECTVIEEDKRFIKVIYEVGELLYVDRIPYENIIFIRQKLKKEKKQCV